MVRVIVKTWTLPNGVTISTYRYPEQYMRRIGEGQTRIVDWLEGLDG